MLSIIEKYFGLGSRTALYFSYHTFNIKRKIRKKIPLAIMTFAVLLLLSISLSLFYSGMPTGIVIGDSKGFGFFHQEKILECEEKIWQVSNNFYFSFDGDCALAKEAIKQKNITDS